MAATSTARVLAVASAGLYALALLLGQQGPAFVAPRAAAPAAARPRTQLRAQMDKSGMMPYGPLVVYNDALVEAAAAKGESVQVTKDMMKVKALFKDEEWLGKLFFVNNEPMTSQTTKARNMLNMMGDFDSTVVPKFVVFLAKKRRLKALPHIAEEYMSSLFEVQNIEPVSLITAQRLSEEQKDQIKEKMKVKTGATDIKLVETVDRSLISGFKLEWGFTDPELLGTPTQGMDLSLSSVLRRAALNKGVPISE